VVLHPGAVVQLPTRRHFNNKITKYHVGRWVVGGGGPRALIRIECKGTRPVSSAGGGGLAWDSPTRTTLYIYTSVQLRSRAVMRLRSIKSNATYRFVKGDTSKKRSRTPTALSVPCRIHTCARTR
jgi:hypothetical protein